GGHAGEPGLSPLSADRAPAAGRYIPAGSLRTDGRPLASTRHTGRVPAARWRTAAALDVNRSSVVGRRSSVVGRRSSVVGRRSSVGTGTQRLAIYGPGGPEGPKYDRVVDCPAPHRLSLIPTTDDQRPTTNNGRPQPTDRRPDQQLRPLHPRLGHRGELERAR